MNRRQLAFVILVNAIISLVIALAVVWVAEMRRPDPADLTTLVARDSAAVLAATPTQSDVNALPTPIQATPETIATGNDTASASGSAGGGEVGEQVVHVVEAGESLGSIAARYGINIETIVQANSLANPDFVFSGQRLIIPAGGANAAPGGEVAPVLGVEILTIESAGDLAQEAVLIANESNTPFNLTGWQLTREDGPTYAFDSVQLFPGSSVRLYSAAGDDNSIALYWGQSEAAWTSGSVAQLRNADGITVDTYTVED